ncbi:MAG: alpha/beta hydrolase [Aggregatilineales bacterium]
MQRFQKFAFLATLFIILSLIPAQVMAQDVSRFEDSACVVAAMESSGLECGTLFVPESRSDASSPVIELAVVIYPGTGETVAADPIIYLDGGPGGSALSGWEFWRTSALRAYGDIILIDQRGTGYSKPTLDCPEVNDFDLENPTRSCRDRLLSEGINLGAYNSAENAADIAALIDTLGLESANLFGISYGTRLALTVMRDHPEKVRSVIIDAVYPPNVNGLDEQVFYGNKAFEVLFDGCAADTACNAAYPNLRDVFYNTVETLNQNPLQLDQGEDGETSEFYGDDLVNQIFQTLYDTNSIPLLPGTIYAASSGDPETYSNFGIDFVPEGSEDYGDGEDYGSYPGEAFETFIVEYLELDDVEAWYELQNTLDEDAYFALFDEVFSSDAFLDFTAEYLELESADAAADALNNLSSDEFDTLVNEMQGFSEDYGDYGDYGESDEDAIVVDGNSEGMYNSVECGEDYPFNSVEATEALSAEVNPILRDSLLISVYQLYDDCELWSVPAQPALENEPVVSDIPTLVLSGQYDPITPPEWGDIAAESLSNSFAYTFPAMGHGSVDTRECPTAIALEFLNTPDAEPDSNCIAGMPGPAFYTGN